MELFDNIDDFNNFGSEQNDSLKISENKITIRVDKRNARKSISYIENWNLNITELKEHLKKMKQSYGCNGSVKMSGDEIVFQLSGDKRDEITKYLLNLGMSEENIVIIG